MRVPGSAAHALPAVVAALAALALAPAAPAAGPTHETARSGSTTAVLTYTRATNGGLPQFRNIRLVIRRGGAVVYDAPVARYPGTRYDVWPARAGSGTSLRFRDLDGDGEPELLLDLYWGGAHCCYWTDVFRYANGAYTPTPHFWGDLSYRLADLDHDGRSVELVSADDRFAYAFASFADSLFPIRIWRYRAGAFADVTRSFPALVRKDAARQWRGFGAGRREKRSVRGALAAWAADECLLGRCAPAYARVRALGPARLTVPDDFESGASYLRSLRRFLLKSGYWPR